MGLAAPSEFSFVLLGASVGRRLIFEFKVVSIDIKSINDFPIISFQCFALPICHCLVEINNYCRSTKQQIPSGRPNCHCILVDLIKWLQNETILKDVAAIGQAIHWCSHSLAHYAVATTLLYGRLKLIISVSKRIPLKCHAP